MIGSGEGGGGGPTDVGVWGRVRKVIKIARLKGQVWECNIPGDEPGPDEYGDQDFLRRTLHSLAWRLHGHHTTPPLFRRSKLDTGCIL